jgi:hypothetical protein
MSDPEPYDIPMRPPSLRFYSAKVTERTRRTLIRRRPITVWHWVASSGFLGRDVEGDAPTEAEAWEAARAWVQVLKAEDLAKNAQAVAEWKATRHYR